MLCVCVFVCVCVCVYVCVSPPVPSAIPVPRPISILLFLIKNLSSLLCPSIFPRGLFFLLFSITSSPSSTSTSLSPPHSLHVCFSLPLIAFPSLSSHFPPAWEWCSARVIPRPPDDGEMKPPLGCGAVFSLFFPSPPLLFSLSSINDPPHPHSPDCHLLTDLWNPTRSSLAQNLSLSLSLPLSLVTDERYRYLQSCCGTNKKIKNKLKKLLQKMDSTGFTESDAHIYIYIYIYIYIPVKYLHSYWIQYHEIDFFLCPPPLPL